MPAGEQAGKWVTWNHFLFLALSPLSGREENTAGSLPPRPSRSPRLSGARSRAFGDGTSLYACGNSRSCTGRVRSDRVSRPTGASGGGRLRHGSFARTKGLGPYACISGSVRTASPRTSTCGRRIAHGNCGSAPAACPGGCPAVRVGYERERIANPCFRILGTLFS